MFANLGEPPAYIHRVNIIILTMTVLMVMTIMAKSLIDYSDILYALIIVELIIILGCILIHKRRVSQIYNAIYKLNKASKMAFTMENTLGNPGIDVLTFDTKNQKIAFCNTITGEYSIQEYNYIASWQLSYLINTLTGNKHAYLSFRLRQPDEPVIQIRLPINIAELWNKKLDHILHN